MTMPNTAGKSITIEFYNVWGGDPAHPVNKLIDTFNAKNTGVTVKGVMPNNDYLLVLQKAQAATAAGSGPAIIATPVAYALFADALLNIVNMDDIAGSEKDQVYATILPASLKVSPATGQDARYSYRLRHTRDVLQQRHLQEGGHGPEDVLHRLGNNGAPRADAQGGSREPGHELPQSERRMDGASTHPVRGWARQWRR